VQVRAGPAQHDHGDVDQREGEGRADAGEPAERDRGGEDTAAQETITVLARGVPVRVCT
jgi:hypothetical protein